MGGTKEQIKAQKRRHYLRHKESIIAYQKSYREKNFDKISEREKRRRLSLDPEEARRIKREEYLRNRETYRAYGRAKRAKKRAENPPPPTLMQQLGMTGRFKDLPKLEKLRFHAEFRKRNAKRLSALAKARYDPQKASDNWARYYAKNAPSLREKQKARTRSDPAKYRALGRAYREADPAKAKARWRAYYAKNRDKMIARSAIYAKENPEKRRATTRAWAKKKYNEDSAFKMMARMRVRFCEILRKQNQKNSFSLRMNKDDLRAHIEKQFLPGMTWENHGKVWHVDHIRPCSSYDFGDPEQARACFSLPNLRPLWAKENMQKKAKILPHLFPPEVAAHKFTK
jgi:hypothetical protein